MRFYHGTSPLNLRGIEARGFCTDVKGWAKGIHASRLAANAFSYAHGHPQHLDWDEHGEMRLQRRFGEHQRETPAC